MKAGQGSESAAAPMPEHADLCCDVCHKRYVRQCDLNKHHKTHSRPFKCPTPGCRFQERGWPTEKELLRHQNDKHSDSPQFFRCLFQPCDYTSKRESNCKQHMEKNHDWQYVRSRPPRSSLSGANPSALLECREEDGSLYEDAEEDSASQAVDPQVVPWAYQPHPSPFDPRLLARESTASNQATNPYLPMNASSGTREPLYGLENLDTVGKESDVFLPWDSPPTKLRKMETVLAQAHPSLFVATAAACSASPDKAAAGAQPPFSPVVKAASSPASDILPAALFGAPSDIGGYGVCSDGRPADGGEATFEHKPKHEYGHHHKRSIDHVSTSAVLGADNRDGPCGNEDADGDLDSRQDDDADGDEDEDGGDEPPPKKTKAAPEDDFNDAEMECPFRSANPDVYKREKNSRYSPCYTTHSQISTIVRHFKRAAHRLTVEDLYISSFDVPSEAEIRHPAAGLCRKCWRSFTDRDEFDRHVSERGCSRVSRSKREKFRLLRDTFCVELLDQDPTSTAAESARLATGRLLPATDAIVYQAGHRASPGAVTAPAAARHGPGNAAARQAVTSPSLVERVDALERTTTELWRMIETMIAPDDARASRLRPCHGEAAAWPAEGAPAPKRQDSGISDKESLVGGMTSQSTDVDRDALIPEVNRTLSTVSSETDRSAIRHVPQPESQDLHAAKPHAPGATGEPSAAGHSRSITDSGFVSDGNGGDVGGAVLADVGDFSASSARVAEDETAASLIGGEFFENEMSVLELSRAD